MIDGSPYFTAVAYYDDYRHLQRDLDRARAMIAVVVPSDFAEAVNAQRAVAVQVLVDGSDANTARLVLAYVQALGLSYNRRLIVERVQHLGGRELTMPVAAAGRAWYNPELRSVNNIVPGIIAVVMMVIAALLTSITVAKEWELGTMEQLISTPVRVPELILGKLAPYFAIGFVDVMIAVAMGLLVFGVPLRGSAALLFIMAAVFLVGALCTGITISIATRRQVLSIQIALLSTFLPTMLLSGFVFAIENMPQAIQYLTYLVPARYFISLLRGIYLKGIGLETYWLSALLLTVWALIMLAVAHRRLRLRLE
jgi:ABC-2 type transport system permease protein